MHSLVRSIFLYACESWAFTAYGMKISAEKTKLMTNNNSGINTHFNQLSVIKVNGQKLETVTSFKYLGSVMTDKDSKPEILSRISQTTAALRRFGMTGVFLSVPRYD